MTGISLSEFMNKIYYGDEVEFKIADTTYFVQGTQSDNKFYLTVDYWNNTDGSEPLHDYLLSIECDSASERMKKFEEANIFNGKNIYQVEKDIEVIYG
jgi:hypothetical protein